MDESATRRRFLRAAATAGVVAGAGCPDGSGAASTADPTRSTPPSASRTTDRSTTRAPTAPTATERGAATTERRATPTAGGTPTRTGTPVHADYETTEVTVETAGGEVLGSVTAAIADTGDLRYLGLSDTESLPEDRGMLFVYESVADRAFVMRRMDFGIDIVYADADGTITQIHHAPAPEPDEDGGEQYYPGRGQYVLEVNYGWTTDRDVEAGDVLSFEL